MKSIQHPRTLREYLAVHEPEVLTGALATTASASASADQLRALPSSALADELDPGLADDD